MKKTGKVGFGKQAKTITCESTGVKDEGLMIWADPEGNYYGLEKSSHLGRATYGFYMLNKEFIENRHPELRK